MSWCTWVCFGAKAELRGASRIRWKAARERLGAPATVCRRGCNRMPEGLQPYVGCRLEGAAREEARRAVGGISVRLHLEEEHRLLLHGVITR